MSSCDVLTIESLDASLIGYFSLGGLFVLCGALRALSFRNVVRGRDVINFRHGGIIRATSILRGGALYWLHRSDVIMRSTCTNPGARDE
jgi:hypothetical protein